MPDLSGRDGFERLVARAFRRVGKRFVDELLAALGDPPNVKNIPQDFWQRYGADLRSELEPTLEKIYLRAAKQTLSETPIGVSWTIPNEAAATWAARYTFDLVKQINQTTVGKLQTYVADYFQTQKTMGELRGQIKPNIGDLRTRSGRLLTSTQRAALIATTEVTRASVQGELDLAKDLTDGGIILVAVWQTNNDDLVCPLCGPRNGHAQGDGWDSPPPGHPGCRCWLNHTVRK